MAWDFNLTKPIPQDKIYEGHPWRDWLFKLQNTVTKINPGYYGSFYDTTTQTVSAISPFVTKALFNSTYLSNGVKVGSTTSQIIVSKAGDYNFIVITEFSKANASTDTVFYWCRVNNVDIPNSTSSVTFGGNSTKTSITFNIMLTMNFGDYFEFCWASTDSAMQSVASAAVTGPPPLPATPSFVLTVTQLDGP